MSGCCFVVVYNSFAPPPPTHPSPVRRLFILLTFFPFPHCSLGDWGGRFDKFYAGGVGRPKLFITFLIYNVLVIIVTLNVFLSIVLDAYSAIKEFQEHEEHESAEAKRSGGAWKKQAMSLSEIMASVKRKRAAKHKSAEANDVGATTTTTVPSL